MTNFFSSTIQTYTVWGNEKVSETTQLGLQGNLKQKKNKKPRKKKIGEENGQVII